MAETVTGCVGTDATNAVTCPRCKKLPCEHCRQPKGALAEAPHRERLAKYKKVIGLKEWLRRHYKYVVPTGIPISVD
jgi:hypothetical protein